MTRGVLYLVAAGGLQPWLAQRGHALLVGVVGIVALVVVLLLLAGSGRPGTHRLRRGTRALLAGGDNRLSTSKTIAAAWTVVVAWMLLTGAIVSLAAGTALGDLAVSNDYLLLLGGPFASAVLAKGIVVTRLANGTLQKSPAPEGTPLRAADLISDDTGRTDLVDFQYALFNLLALGIVVALFVIHPDLGLPNVPAGLLAVTSAAAAAYVGNKAIATTTPQISRVDPGSARPGQAVTLLGSNLIPPGTDASQQPPTVTVNDMVAPVVGTARATAVTVRIPAYTPVSEPGQPATVGLVSDAAGSARAQGTLVVLPDAVVLSQLAPATAAPGDLVTLSGRGFLAAAALAPADDVTVDPPLVVLATAGSGATPARELARVSAAEATDARLTFPMPALSVGPATRLTVTVVRGGLTSRSLPMLLAALPASPREPSQARPASVDASGGGFAVGVGVATINGKPRLGTAVSFTSPPTAPNWWQDTRISLCESSEEVYSALDLSVDAAASYGPVSASGKFKLAQSCDKLGYSLYLVVRATKRSALTVATDIALTKDARGRLETGDFAGFLRQYGDKFVSGQVKGGEYTAVLAINSSSETAKQEIKNSLGVSAAVGEFSTSVQTDVTTTLNTYASQLQMQLMVSIQGLAATGAALQGSTATAMPTTAQATADVFTAVRAFPDSVTDRNAGPLTAQLSEYTELDLPDAPAFMDYLHGVHGLDGPIRALDAIAAQRKQLVADLDRVRAVLRSPFGFTEPATALRARFEPLAAEPLAADSAADSPSLPGAIARLDQTASTYAEAVATSGDATAVTAPRPPSRAPIGWPTRPLVPTYLIRSAADNSLVLSAPANDPTGSLVLASADPRDPLQLWLVPNLGSGSSFTMRNVATDLYATHTGEGGQVTQTGDGSAQSTQAGDGSTQPTQAGHRNAQSTQWTLLSLPPLPWFHLPDGSVVQAAGGQVVLNAEGGYYRPGTPVILWGFKADNTNSYWEFEHVDAATAPTQRAKVDRTSTAS